MRTRHFFIRVRDENFELHIVLINNLYLHSFYYITSFFKGGEGLKSRHRYYDSKNRREFWKTKDFMSRKKVKEFR